MRLLRNSTVTVNRYGEQAVNDVGDIVITDGVTFNIKCNYQPIPNVQKGEVAQILPSGVQISDLLILYTQDTLRLDDEENQIIGDEVIINGNLYKAFQERNWTAQPFLKHKEYLLIRKTKR
jgi:hypothetical protein